VYVAEVSSRSDVFRETRWLAAVIIPFLVVAFVILWVFPERTAELFAWEIRPPMTAMMLGSAYAGGVWFFARVLRARYWREFKAGFPAVGTFATLLGIATILHWDRFIQDALPFWVWSLLYFTTPVLVFGTWYRQRRADTDPRTPELVFPAPIRAAFGVVGVAMVGVSAVLFLAPEQAIGAWPWTLTPLTARVMAAMFALPGLVGLGIGIDPRWSVARILIESQVLSIGLILVGAWRDLGSIDMGAPAGIAFVGGLATLEVCLVLLYLGMQRRAATQRRFGAAATAD